MNLLQGTGTLETFMPRGSSGLVFSLGLETVAFTWSGCFGCYPQYF